ncbi:MAG TPA: tetratricopeptide repeat protein [Ohtaekwangia sp.]|nr:tetratricopeptide repeat protein [Ohtaekwangia sp.]
MTAQVTALLLSCFFIVFSDSHGQHQRLDSLIQVATIHHNDTLGVIAYADLCYEYRFVHQDSALLFGKMGIELGKKIKYTKGLAQAYSDAAFIYFDKSDFENAIKFWNEALQLRKELKDAVGSASLYIKLGAAHFKSGNYELSLRNQMDALKTYEALNIPQGIAQCLNNIAAVYEHQNQLDKALEYYKKAAVLHEQLKDPIQSGTTWINIGNIHFHRQEYNNAKSLYLKSAALLNPQSRSTHHYLAICFNNLSEIYTLESLYDSALIYSNKALDLRRNIKDFQGIVSSMNMIGRIKTKLHQYEDAENILVAALDSSKSKNLRLEQSKIYQNLYALYRKRGELENALESFMSYATLKDSLLNESGQKQIAELQVKYETDKKEQQIVIQEAALSEQQARIERDYIIIIGLIVSVILLGIIFLLLRNRQIRKQEILHKEHQISVREAFINASIQSQENERKRFAQDLHDGMGQWISSLRLALSDVQEANTDERKIEVVERSEKIMEEMNREFRSIAFNLMPHTLIQYGLTPAINEMSMRINTTGKFNIEVSSFNFPERLTELHEISLYRIIQEWTNNIIKYAGATTIGIQLIGHEDELNIMIEDNGKGFDPGKLENSKGNGWKNIQSRLNLIRGSADIDSAPDRRGTTFTLKIPSTMEVAKTFEHSRTPELVAGGRGNI